MFDGCIGGGCAVRVHSKRIVYETSHPYARRCSATYGHHVNPTRCSRWWSKKRQALAFDVVGAPSHVSVIGDGCQVPPQVGERTRYIRRKAAAAGFIESNSRDRVSDCTRLLPFPSVRVPCVVARTSASALSDENVSRSQPLERPPHWTLDWRDVRDRGQLNDVCRAFEWHASCSGRSMAETSPLGHHITEAAIDRRPRMDCRWNVPFECRPNSDCRSNVPVVRDGDRRTARDGRVLARTSSYQFMAGTPS